MGKAEIHLIPIGDIWLNTLLPVVDDESYLAKDLSEQVAITASRRW